MVRLTLFAVSIILIVCFDLAVIPAFVVGLVLAVIGNQIDKFLIRKGVFSFRYTHNY